MPVAHQPLIPSVRSLLDPQYVSFHDQVLQYLPVLNTLPPPGPRPAGNLLPGSSAVRQVDKVEEFDLCGGRFRVRAFSPKGTAPVNGWPALLWFHGGGWVWGSLDSENHIASRMTDELECVSVACEYRKAPEDPFPAAVEDAIDALKWLATEGKSILSVDDGRIAVGGCSAGGNLAAVVSLHAHELSIKLCQQVLLVPVVDNTLDETSEFWKPRVNVPWLPPSKMLWYRKVYMPNSQTWSHPDASPILADDDVLRTSPPTFVGVAEQDLLCFEGQAYAQKLKDLGVKVECKVYKGCTHQLPSLDGIMDKGKILLDDVTHTLRQAFNRQS
ncbi:hypothetical protein OIV83_001905 [Microbotryomycetes sp. JL201]|nr:hypothetical protein OIV83_001905 [Microbotryomycetes sp. JL201]